MKRFQHYATKQLWCLVLIFVSGVLLLYMLSISGVLDAMRDDHTLDALYQQPGKFPKPPPLMQQPHQHRGFPAMTTASGDVINGAQERRLQQLKAMAMLVRQDIKQNHGAPVTTESNTKPSSIPHILHQTWDSFDVPKSFVKGIQSFSKLHPQWEYWFWTPKAVLCFLKQRFPQFSELFKSYPDATSKADALRYFILYTFGGVYADIDSVFLKPLDMWARKYCCLLSEEPYEHSYIVRQSNVSNIVNSPMACQAHHPLFHMAFSGLPQAAATYFGDYIQSTGPAYLERVYEQYVKNNSNSSGGSSCVPVLAPPKYFLPRYDPSQSEIIESRCSVRSYKTLNAKQQRACERVVKKEYKNEVDVDSYMDHMWIHVSLLGSDWKRKNTVKLHDVMPSAKIMETQFCNDS